MKRGGWPSCWSCDWSLDGWCYPLNTLFIDRRLWVDKRFIPMVERLLEKYVTIKFLEIVSAQVWIVLSCKWDELYISFCFIRCLLKLHIPQKYSNILVNFIIDYLYPTMMIPEYSKSPIGWVTLKFPEANSDWLISWC